MPGQVTSTVTPPPSSKVVRLGMGTGMVQISLEPRPDGRLRIGIAHEGLPSPDDVEVLKAYWEEWPAAIDQA